MQQPWDSSEQFDLIGNHPGTWKESACDLLFAAKTLSNAEADQEKEASKDDTKIPFLRCFWPRIMLRAFAFECLATAIRAKNGETIYEKGRLKKSKDHRLSDMLAAAGLTLSSEDKNLLDRMTAVAVAHGRFPLPTHPARFIDFQPGRSGEFRIEWASPQDEIRYFRLLDKLMEQCGFSDFEKTFYRT